MDHRPAACLPEQVDTATLQTLSCARHFELFLEDADATPIDAENVEKPVPEALRFSATKATTVTLPLLSLLETRVLGVLIEKQHTVADTYPLTLNALTAGCNQKTSRDPVLNAGDAEVQSTVDRLKSLSLTVESSGGRVMRYAHNVERVLSLPSQAVALLATLMLRGAQTPGELRINSDRLHRFADISAVDGFLQELAARPSGALVAELPRAPGSRENRWMHLLSGAAPDSVPANLSSSPGGDVVTLAEIAAIKANVQHLEDELEALKSAVAKLRSELGGT